MVSHLVRHRTNHMVLCAKEVDTLHYKHAFLGPDRPHGVPGVGGPDRRYSRESLSSARPDFQKFSGIPVAFGVVHV